MAARDVGLKPADFDAMTAAARIECGDCGKVNECEALGPRSLPAGREARICGKTVIYARKKLFGNSIPPSLS